MLFEVISIQIKYIEQYTRIIFYSASNEIVFSDVAEFCYKVTDFYHPGDEGGLAWNDPEIGIEWPKLEGEYKGNADSDGYTVGGTPLNLSDKDKKWLGLKDTFKF